MPWDTRKSNHVDEPIGTALEWSRFHAGHEKAQQLAPPVARCGVVAGLAFARRRTTTAQADGRPRSRSASHTPSGPVALERGELRRVRAGRQLTGLTAAASASWTSASLRAREDEIAPASAPGRWRSRRRRPRDGESRWGSVVRPSLNSAWSDRPRRRCRARGFASSGAVLIGELACRSRLDVRGRRWCTTTGTARRGSLARSQAPPLARREREELHHCFRIASRGGSGGECR